MVIKKITIEEINGIKKDSFVYTQNSFGVSYIGEVVKIEKEIHKTFETILIYVKDSNNEILPRNLKKVRLLNNE